MAGPGYHIQAWDSTARRTDFLGPNHNAILRACALIAVSSGLCTPTKLKTPTPQSVTGFGPGYHFHLDPTAKRVDIIGPNPATVGKLCMTLAINSGLCVRNTTPARTGAKTRTAGGGTE
jgi:hypothetical protein